MPDVSAAASSAEALKTIDSLRFTVAVSWGVISILFAGLIAFGAYIFNRFDKNQETLKKSVFRINRTLTILVERHNGHHSQQPNVLPIPQPDLES